MIQDIFPMICFWEVSFWYHWSKKKNLFKSFV